MTYCVGLKLDRGLVFMSDTRTNAGVDNVSVFKKMFTWEVPGERLLVLMTAGNLGTTQSVIAELDDHAKAASKRKPHLLGVPSMYEAARLVGKTVLRVQEDQGGGKTARGNSRFEASLILGGQIKGGEPRLYMIYPEGNFIEASDDTPFLQIGETKYGRPILVRAYDPQMPFDDAIKLLMVSFDSTIKANLSVDLPIDMQIYEEGSMRQGYTCRVERDDPYFGLISSGWGAALRDAFHSLPKYQME